MKILSVLLFSLFFISCSSINTSEVNKKIVLKSFDNWTEGKGGIFDLLADNARWTVKGRNHFISNSYTKEELIKNVIIPFNQKLKTALVPKLQHLYADKDVVILIFNATATTREDYTYKNSYAWVLKMKDEKIIEVDAFLDMVEFDKVWSIK